MMDVRRTNLTTKASLGNFRAGGNVRRGAHGRERRKQSRGGHRPSKHRHTSTLRRLKNAIGKLKGNVDAGSLREIPDPVLYPEDLNPVVGQVMNRNVVYLKEDNTVREAIQIFLSSGISGAPVVNRHEKVIGILSESDIIDQESDVHPNGFAGKDVPQGVSLFEQFLEDFSSKKFKKLLNSPVKDLMTHNPVTISPESTVVHAARLMVDHNINRLPVCFGDELVGIVTRGDVLQCMIWEILMAGNTASRDES